MLGVKGKEDLKGIIPNAFDHIFGCIDGEENEQKKYLVRCSYVEIYNEEIRDLLSPHPGDHKLELKETKQKGVFVKDLTTNVVKSIKEIERTMNKGNNKR